MLGNAILEEEEEEEKHEYVTFHKNRYTNSYAENALYVSDDVHILMWHVGDVYLHIKG